MAGDVQSTPRISTWLGTTLLPGPQTFTMEILIRLWLIQLLDQLPQGPAARNDTELNAFLTVRLTMAFRLAIGARTPILRHHSPSGPWAPSRSPLCTPTDSEWVKGTKTSIGPLNWSDGAPA
jgi:hypothetical protein